MRLREVFEFCGIFLVSGQGGIFIRADLVVEGFWEF
jgi:hypothetical protein